MWGDAPSSSRAGGGGREAQLGQGATDRAHRGWTQAAAGGARGRRRVARSFATEADSVTTARMTSRPPHRTQTRRSASKVRLSEEAAHDLSASRPRQLRKERDLFGRDGRAEANAGKSQELRRERVVRLEARLERHERLDDLHRDGVRLADDSGLGHRGVLEERALDLERPDEVPGRFDDVVGAPDEPEVAVRVAAG